MKVSVCMATYNGAKYIKGQVDSILGQKFNENPDVEMEVIVSDDGSVDGTVAIVEAYNDERIKIYHHQEHKKHKWYNGYFSASSNFANAMKHANGDYIFLSDQDDVWYPDKIDKTLTVLKEKGGVVAMAFDFGDKNLNKTGSLIYKDQPFFALRYYNSLYGFSCGFDRKELHYILPLDGMPFHDTFIMLSAQLRHRMHYIEEKCAIHRWTGTHNVSVGGASNNTPLYVRLFYRIRMWTIILFRYMSFK